MKFNYIKSFAPAAALLLGLSLSACVDDLNHAPIDPTLDTEVDELGLFNKCYAGLILEGNDGSADFTIDDGGKSVLLRNLFNMNEVCTDEAICWWTDGGIENVSINMFTPSDLVLKFLYYRLMSNVTFCNKYLQLYSSDSEYATHVAEVRFLRAYHYYLLMDFFGNAPFVEAPGQKPVQKPRAELFQWVDDELELALQDMSPAKAKTKSSDANYGRADQAAVWFLRSRMYLNAKVYLDKDWSDATIQDYLKKSAENAEKVYASGTGYKLFTDADHNTKYKAYEMLFMGDNGENGSACESVLSLFEDGLTTQGWGGSMFFMAALWDPKMDTPYEEGLGSTANNWSGMRVRKQLLEKFTDDPYAWEGKTSKEIREMLEASNSTRDDRALFWGAEYGSENGIHSVDLENEKGINADFGSGLTTVKWNNNHSDGSSTHDAYNVDTDFFLFRVAEAKLNHAEALYRLNNACTDKVKADIDEIRNRAHKAVSTTYTLNDILDERARELYCECLRRPDLIRFDQFGGSQATYHWDLKYNVLHGGASFPKEYNIYPIPTAERETNPDFVQNKGYN